MTFQERVTTWLRSCFRDTTCTDRRERGDRFLEEALELLQANGYPQDRIGLLVDRVYGRPVGEPAQEVGAVMITLAAYCFTTDIDMHDAAEAELARVNTPEMIARLRAKDEARLARGDESPLPGDVA